MLSKLFRGMIIGYNVVLAALPLVFSFIVTTDLILAMVLFFFVAFLSAFLLYQSKCIVDHNLQKVSLYKMILLGHFIYYQAIFSFFSYTIRPMSILDGPYGQPSFLEMVFGIVFGFGILFNIVYLVFVLNFALNYFAFNKIEEEK